MARDKKEENKEGIDVSKLKKELTNYIDTQIKKNFNDELERANKKLIREKNKKLFVRNIIIIILICVIGFLLYLLNTVDYFDKFFVNEVIEPVKVVEKGESKEIEKEEKSLNELKEVYGYLIDNITINETSEYVNDFYNGNLTSNLKKYITLNNMDFDKFIVDDYSVIDEDSFKNEYNKLFDDEYVNSSFVYNNNKVSYIEKLKSYITNSILVKKESNIEREIVNIEVLDDKILITTIEGLVKNKKLYNIVSNEEVKGYKKDSLSNYKKNLNKVVYTFDDNKLISIGN